MSDSELDALNYISGTGLYEKYQDPATKPNIFDTEKSFLLKMQNDKLRVDYLTRCLELRRIKKFQ